MENDNGTLMRATKEWMARKYQEMNSWLFNGKLGDCNLEVFTSGKGSQGGILGWFCVDGGRYALRVERNTRRMFAEETIDIIPRKYWINKDNFTYFCHPTIKLNGNYQGTEDSLLATLIHEMCHYYTYMYGWCPSQAHGADFRNIADIVASRSNGKFTIQKVATAEEMSGYELDDEMKRKKQQRLDAKKSKTTVVIIFKRDGQVRMLNASTPELVNKITNEELSLIGNAKKVLTSNDANLINFLFNKGYERTWRTYNSYWEIQNKPEILSAVQNKDEYDIQERK